MLDVEVSTDIERLPNGWDDTHKMEIAVAAVMDAGTGRFDLYDNDTRSRRSLLDRIQKADRITTYNGWQFDIPVILGVERKSWLSGRMVPGRLKTRSDDLFKRIKSAAQHDEEFRPRKNQLDLGSVCSLNLGTTKTGNGREVIGIYRERRFAELANYCMNDVRVTKALCDHIDRTGRIGITNRNKTLVLTVGQWDDDR